MATALHVTSCQDEFRQQQIAVLWRATGATHTQVITDTHLHNHVLHCVPIFTGPAVFFCRDIWCVGLWRHLVLTSLLHSTCSKTHDFLCLQDCLFSCFSSFQSCFAFFFFFFGLSPLSFPHILLPHVFSASTHPLHISPPDSYFFNTNVTLTRIFPAL